MKNNLLVEKNVHDFYNSTSEEDRLTQGLGPLEFERNKQLIERYLTKENCHILDVGGGTGKYSEWLAAKGHSVILIDPIQKHIKQAKVRASKQKEVFDAQLGEARRLDFPDSSQDIVILHGPLYHLQDKTERQKAIQEAKRVLKAEGIILGFAINYTASTLVALLQGLIHDETIYNMCLTELTTGIHNAPQDMPGVLDGAFYHKQEELENEFQELGFKNLNLYAVEGLIWLNKNYFTTRGNKDKFRKILELTKITEQDKNLISLSPHMMIAAEK